MTLSADPKLSRSHGSVYTKQWVTGFILDLVGYVAESNLAEARIIEPACGDGAFVAEIVERLVESAAIHDVKLDDARDALLAFDIDEVAVKNTRTIVVNTLVRAGMNEASAAELARVWVRSGDFLKLAIDLPQVDWIVGNPPYVRPEHIDPQELSLYREQWTTMRGRADIYIGFFEAALSLLSRDQARLAFLCADRWMRNQYGSRLRERVSSSFSLDLALELHGVDVFERRVHAYPSIVVIRKGISGPTFEARATERFGERDAGTLLGQFRRGPSHSVGAIQFSAHWQSRGHVGTQSWPAARPSERSRLESWAARLPSLEESGVKVNSGMATGADRVFFVDERSSIEPSRLLKVVGPSDLNGKVNWGRKYFANPWGTDGQLVDLDEFPELRAHFESHRVRLNDRYVARKSPEEWYRTIDKPNLARYMQPKLLVPDLKDRVSPTLDDDGYVPMHTLYTLSSARWDLSVLGGLLMSDIANSFVSAFSVRFANGRMRVSAQYLKRIRLPRLESIDSSTADQLSNSFRERDVRAASTIARELYR